MLAIEVVTDLERFRNLKDDWNTLAAAAGSSIFQTWEWSWYWWKSNSRGKKLSLLVVRDAGTIVGIAPIYLSSTQYGLPLKVAAFIGTNGTDYLDLIADSDVPDAAVALYDALFDASEWDAIDLHQLSSDRSTAREVVEKAKARGCSCTDVIQDHSFSVELPGSWEEYLATLSKKFRWNVQYYARRLARDHDMLIRLSGPETVREDMELFFKLHQKRFLAKKKPGAYLNPKFRKFHIELAAALCESGWLRLYVMQIDGLPVATLYGFVLGDTFYYYLGGFEPEWAAMSVSTVLIGRAIEDSIAAGIRKFDFLRGQEPYKQKWLAQESSNHRVIISRTGKRAGLMQKLLTVENDLTRRVKDKME
ncbi:MAG: GNAT family N-acetyltransferase [Candidatus Aquicultor sp.]